MRAGPHDTGGGVESSVASAEEADSSSVERFTRAHEAALSRFADVENLGNVDERNGAGEKPCCEEANEKFFDSRDYRCFFNVFHAKIGMFVFCTWILHEIVLAALFLLSRKEFKDARPSPSSVVLLACRLIQIPTVGILYVGLWLHRRNWLLPFGIAQFTIGIYADISTLMLCLTYLEEHGYTLPFAGAFRWMNVALPLLLYAAIIGWLAWVLYRCYEFIGARVEHDQRRRKEKERQKQMEEELMQRFGIAVERNDEDDDDIVDIGDLDSLGENVNRVEEEGRSVSPSPPSSLKRSAVRLELMRRTPSSVTNQPAPPIQPHFHLVERQSRVVKQWHHTGSLQQLQHVARKPSATRRLMSLSTTAPFRRLAHEQSEPVLALLQNRAHTER